jgi:hypothetical protein
MFKKSGLQAYPSEGANEKEVLRHYLNWRIPFLSRLGISYTDFRPKLYLELLDSDPFLEGPVDIKGTKIT